MKLKKLSSILGVSIFSILVLSIYLLNQSDEFLIVGKPQQKLVEVEDLKIVGWKEGQKEWEIKTKYAWAYQSLDQSTVEEVVDGKFYDQGHIILDNLQAQLVKANSYTERLQADGKISAIVIRYQQKPPQKIKIFSEQLLYDANTKLTELKKDVRLYDEQAKVYTQSAQVNHVTEQVIFDSGIVFKQNRDTLQASYLLVDYPQSSYWFKNGVQFTREPEVNPQNPSELNQRKTLMSCQMMKLYSNEKITRANLKGAIKIQQPGKILVGETGIYDQNLDTFTVSQNTQLLISDSEKILNETDLKNLSQSQLNEILEEDTYLTADQLTVWIDQGDFKAEGQVTIRQKNRQATAQLATMNDKDRKIYLSQGVRILREDGSWIDAEQVIVDTKNKEFIAIGNVESETFQ